METTPPIDRQGEQQLVPRFRKRTRRACDKCSSSRVRCDGECPCRRCQEYGHACQYARDIRKRGRKRAGAKDGEEAGMVENQLDTPIDAPSSESLIEDERALHDEVLQDESAQTRQSIHQEPFELQHPQERTTGEDGFFQYPREHQRNSTTSFPQLHRTASYATNPEPRSPLDHSNDLVLTRSHSSRPAVTLPGFASHFAQDIAGFSPQATQGPAPGPIPISRHERTSHSSTAIVSHVNSTQYASLASQCAFRVHKCLEPILPLIEDIISPEVSNELLEFYFSKPGSSLFRVASPYILTHVLRKQTLLHPTKPRETTPALLVTILWVSAQTADIPILSLPGSRSKICEQLRRLSLVLLQRRDRDHWHRLPGGRLEEDDVHHSLNGGFEAAHQFQHEPPLQSIDDLLAFILMSIVVSGGDFKTDCFTWWSKAIRLSQSFGLNREDGVCQGSGTTCIKALCTCRTNDTSLAFLEAKEERRRVFWLLFCLDRHLALSFNGVLAILDDECEVYTPLPDDVWENLEAVPFDMLKRRTLGPPTKVTGTGFFEYFLPLMAIMGDVIQIHHRKNHPRLRVLDASDAVSLIEDELATCARSISEIASRYDTDRLDGTVPASEVLTPSSAYHEESLGQSFDSSGHRYSKSRAQAQLVTAYSTFILHVLHVLLHGKWDAVSMLENEDGWITSVEFMKCASHAIAASEAVSKILKCDPELTFMPYLFGIYLLHGSFILLLFADRMPQLGPNESVERACETIIRAHEVCVVTLSTEFQKRFRKVLRSTLYSVRSAGATNIEESKARRRALSLYRWTKGSRGLAL